MREVLQPAKTTKAAITEKKTAMRIFIGRDEFNAAGFGFVAVGAWKGYGGTVGFLG